VVRRTGGLADSVVDPREEKPGGATATGFTFDRPAADDLLAAVRRAIEAFREPLTWRTLQQNGMARDFRWDASARRYLDVYAAALSRPRTARSAG
jgi:starch synthase